MIIITRNPYDLLSCLRFSVLGVTRALLACVEGRLRTYILTEVGFCAQISRLGGPGFVSDFGHPAVSIS